MFRNNPLLVKSSIKLESNTLPLHFEIRSQKH